MDIIPSSLSSSSLEAYLARISSRSRIIYWLIIGMIVACIAVLPFIYVDVSVQARGYFQSDIEKQIVYTPFQGKIVYSAIHNGNHVNRGDTLLVIDSETIKAQQNALLQRMAENDASILDLEKLSELDSMTNHVTPGELITERYKAELANLLNQQSIQFRKYSKKKTEHERNEILYNQDIIPAADFENSMFQLEFGKRESESDNYLPAIIMAERSHGHEGMML